MTDVSVSLVWIERFFATLTLVRSLFAFQERNILINHFSPLFVPNTIPITLILKKCCFNYRKHNFLLILNGIYVFFIKCVQKTSCLMVETADTDETRFPTSIGKIYFSNFGITCRKWCLMCLMCLILSILSQYTL